MKLNEMITKKAEIICLKNQGLSLREIAETYFSDIEDASETQIVVRVKTIWDNYKKAQRKALSSEENEEENIEKTEKTSFSSATSEKQEINENADGTKSSNLQIPANSLSKNIQSYSKEDLLKLHGFTPVEDWEIVSVKSSRWQAQASGGDIIEMVSSKISATPKNYESKLLEEIIKNAEEKFGPISKKRHPVPVAKENADEIAIASFADFHLDKREAHNTAMSFERQVERFYAIVDWYYNQFKEIKNLGKIAFYWSQDFFNYDYFTEETTSRRNKQDSSAGYRKMVENGDMMLINAIEKLEELAPVELFYTRSNHDQHTAFGTMAALFCAFRKDENVLIDGMTATERASVWADITDKQTKGIPVEYDALFDSAGRHYLMWGDTLFGFAHGDTEGKRIHNVMQVEADTQFARLYAKKNNISFNGNININSLPDFPEKFAWSKTRHHVFFCGHFHSKQQLVKDESGVEVIYLGTEMTGDAWHSDCGYIGAQQRIEAYIYDKRGQYKILGTTSNVLKEDWEKLMHGKN